MASTLQNNNNGLALSQLSAATKINDEDVILVSQKIPNESPSKYISRKMKYGDLCNNIEQNVLTSYVTKNEVRSLSDAINTTISSLDTKITNVSSDLIDNISNYVYLSNLTDISNLNEFLSDYASISDLTNLCVSLDQIVMSSFFDLDDIYDADEINDDDKLIILKNDGTAMKTDISTLAASNAFTSTNGNNGGNYPGFGVGGLFSANPGMYSRSSRVAYQNDYDVSAVYTNEFIQDSVSSEIAYISLKYWTRFAPIISGATVNMQAMIENHIYPTAGIQAYMKSNDDLMQWTTICEQPLELSNIETQVYVRPSLQQIDATLNLPAVSKLRGFINLGNEQYRINATALGSMVLDIYEMSDSKFENGTQIFSQYMLSDYQTIEFNPKNIDGTTYGYSIEVQLMGKFNGAQGIFELSYDNGKTWQSYTTPCNDKIGRLNQYSIATFVFGSNQHVVFRQRKNNDRGTVAVYYVYHSMYGTARPTLDDIEKALTDEDQACQLDFINYFPSFTNVINLETIPKFFKMKTDEEEPIYGILNDSDSGFMYHNYTVQQDCLPTSISVTGINSFNANNSVTQKSLQKIVGSKYLSLIPRNFYGCSQLVDVNLSNSTANLTSIPSYCFFNCTSLSNIALPEGVTTFGQYAFCRCDSLSNVVLPNSLTSISRNSFNACANITTMRIPPSCTTLDYGAFTNMQSLSSISLPITLTSCLVYSGYNSVSYDSIIYAFHNCPRLSTQTASLSIELSSSKDTWTYDELTSTVSNSPVISCISRSLVNVFYKQPNNSTIDASVRSFYGPFHICNLNNTSKASFISSSIKYNLDVFVYPNSIKPPVFMNIPA